jgi:flavin reductase (DIM6/NTAB) family NADH-FMN oxidoreductase RutF
MRIGNGFKPRKEKKVDEQAEAAKKATLLTIPYGLYIMGAKDSSGLNAGTVNWVTQCSFKPPLLAMGVKKDSHLYAMVKESGVFSLSFLESGQKDLAFAFFRPAKVEGDMISGQRFETHETGAPIIEAAPGWVEGRIVGEVEVGDHSCMVGEVTNAGHKRDFKLLTLEECGVKYGG